MMKRLLSTIALASVGCSGPTGGDDDNGDAGAGSDAADAGGQIDAVPEPTPVFTIGSYNSGRLAITADGLRATYRIGSTEYESSLTMGLHENDGPTWCAVVLRPAVVALTPVSAANRVFATATIDIGASAIATDECGWDDAYMMAQFAGFGDGTIQVGFTMARFPEDRPYLDVLLDRSWPFPDDSAVIVLVADGTGQAMDDDGIVNTAAVVEPTGGTFIQGLYQW